MTQYVGVDAATGRILYGVGKPDPADFQGTQDLRPFPREGVVYYAWQGRLSFAEQPTPTCECRWVDGAVQWVETSTLGDAVARALDAIDAAADAARADVLARKPTKAEEYTQAEAQARAWVAAGYAGAAPDDVASWAEAKRREGMTERQAADSIIEQADAYRALLSGIRRLRLVHMENTRHAVTPSDAHAEVSTFNAALADLMPM